MQLCQPRPPDGCDDIRATVDHMFAERPRGISVGDLEQIGWFDLHDELPVVAARALFEGQGAALAVAGTLEAYLLAELSTWGEDFAVDESAVVLVTTAESGRYRGLVHDTPTSATYLFEDADGAVRTATAEDAAATQPVDTIDDSLHLVEVQITPGAGQIVVDAPPGLLTRRVRIALSWQLIGVCERMLQMGVEHAKARHQFGRPIGSFQAVQHLLADAAVAIATGQAVIEAAQAAGDDTSGDITSLAAAAAASRALAATSRAAQQVLGAIGYTWEHDFHRYLRRGMVVDLLLGVDDYRVGMAASKGAVPIVEAVSTWVGDHAKTL